MSRRTFPKCIAAGLLAAVVSPAAAQSPNPWRTGGAEVAPAPRPVAPRSIPLTFEWTNPPAPKPAPPPEMQASMLRELERMGAQTTVSGMTLPSPRYLHHYPQYVPADPAFPLQRELATPCPTPVATSSDIPATLPPTAAVRTAGSPPVGLWHRSVGSMAYTVGVKDEHLTITVKMSVPTDGGTATQGMVVTGDYHVSRDGSNLVGLITSVDATVEGATQPDEVAKVLAKLQKGLTDKPFAVSFRVYDGTLVIGNVRMPTCEDTDIADLLGAMGGQYRTVRETTPPKEVPAGGLTPVVPATQFRTGKAYPTDPNVRMRQLLFQSEDQRQIDTSWRDFWFREPSHHLTPERIHGGIF